MIIRFPTHVDLRQAPTPTLRDRIRDWFNPPKKAEVFEIKNPRFFIARQRARRKA